MLTRNIGVYWLVFFVGVSSIRPTVWAAQLSPYVLIERHLVQVERLSNEQEHRAALATMDRVIALQEEHDLTVPEELHFVYAQLALAAGLIQVAIDSVNRYLEATNQSAEFYTEALQLWDRAEAAQAVEARQRAEAAEARQRAEAAEARQRAEAAEVRRRAEAAEVRRRAEAAEARRRAEAAEARQRAQEAEAQAFVKRLGIWGIVIGVVTGVLVLWPGPEDNGY